MSRTLINVSGTMLLAGLVFVAAGSAQAFYHGAESGDFTGRTATEEELYKALIPPPPQNDVRSIPFATRGISPVRKTRKADLTVNFGFDSAELTAEGKGALKPVGRVLGSAEGRKHRFQIEGHTDSVGSEAYNMDLSMRRAKAVKAYLVSEFNIDAARLIVIGKGESQPMKGRTPDDALNRRVRLITVVN